MTSKKTFLLVFVLLLALTSCGQVRIPTHFIETTQPKPMSKEWYLLNNSVDDCGVKFVNNQLEAIKVREIDKSELEISNGKIIGVDRGEWGGTLAFEPNDKTQNPIEIKRGNIKFIFTLNNKIYFIEGLAHMTVSQGALYELSSVNNVFTYKKVLDFEDAPEAFTLYKSELLIATHKNFYIVKDFKKEIIFENTFWNSLYPNSIVAIDNENVFLGIRGGIVKLDLTNKLMKFYKYNH